MNQIKNIGSSENPKHNFQGNNTTSVKRNNSTEISISSTKKIKLDNTVWNTDGILIKKPVNESTKDEHTKKSFKKESVVKTFQNFPNQDGEVSGEKGKSAFNNIRNLTIPSPSSPRNSEDFVVIASSAADYIVDKDCDKSSRNKPIPETSNTLLNTNITGRKELNSKCSGQTETADVGILPLNQEINTNEFDVVMLSSIQEQKPIQQLSLSSDNSHSGSLSRVVASGGNIMRPSTVTYTRITTASTISAGLPQNATVLNRRNISPNLKNQQVMTTSKKLTSEVTQTTAKVSIGNTTISVPLLKPLNSSQHVHQSNSGVSEIQKQSQANTQTSSQQLSSQTQINLSKILTTKQGYKGSHPTIVSLSQLQIKPVSTTKLVQTKVFGKKLPQLQCSVATNSQPNSGLVTIAVSKAKPNIALNQSSSKKINFKTDSGGLLHNNVNLEDGPSATDSNAAMEKMDFTNEKIETSISDNHMLDSNISKTLGSIQNSLKIVSPVSDEIPLNKTAATIKKVLNPNVNILPLLTPLSKNTEQQGNTNIYPAVSIIRQNVPQLITTSATTTCVSVSTGVSDNNVQTEFHSTKQANLNNLCGKLNSSSIISIPKNISLVLSKNNTNQQSKATIVSNSVRNANLIDQKIKKINLTVSSALNVSTVSSLNTVQPFNISNNSSTQNHSQPSQDTSPINKSAVISVAVQPPSLLNSTDQSLLPRKTVKVTPYTLSSLGQHLDKRCKSLEVHEQEHRQNISQNVDILPTKRNKYENPEVSADVFESFNKKEAVDNPHSYVDAKSIKNLDKHGNIELNKSPITVPKSEDSNNVLLKKLLQNSSSSQHLNIHTSISTNMLNPVTNSTPASVCSQVLSARKVINVRAPCLGLVSSLEAQLARPVIPPVPATTAASVQSEIPKSQKSDTQEDLLNKINNEVTVSQNDGKIKCVQVISKETSFVSNPNISPFPLDDPCRSKLTVTGQDLENESFKVNKATCEKNDTSNTSQQNYLHNTQPKECNGSEAKEGNSLGNICPSNKTTSTICSGSINNQTLGSDVSTIFTPSTERKEETNVEHFSNFVPSFPALTDPSENAEKSENIRTKANVNNLLDASAKSKVPSRYDNEPQNSNTQVNLKLDNKSNLNEKNLQSECNDATNIVSIDQKTIAIDKIDKDIESRKKRKREYQKQRRLLLSGKESNANAVNSTTNVPGPKKRSRKLSKIEEDYDNFIDNLMTHLKQMKPLQVLEPLLNRNFLVCNAYGLSSNLPRGVSSKENGDHSQTPPLLGEYGNAHHSNASTLYDTESFLSSENNKDKKLSTIQNDFYDQEFSSNMRNNYSDRYLRVWSIMKERNIESSDIVTNCSVNSVDIVNTIGEKFNMLSLQQLIYPGLVVMNKNNEHYVDRMSPGIPFIDSTFNMKKGCLVKAVKQIDGIENVNQILHTGTDIRMKRDESHNRVVTLSVQLSAVNNIFGVLKDLANLLHIPTPTMYKIIDKPTFNLSHDLIPKNNIKLTTKSQISLQQDVICGRKKICYNCGASIADSRIKSFKVPFCDMKEIRPSTLSPDLSPMTLQFCDKYCYEHFNNPHKALSSNVKSKMEDAQITSEQKFCEETLAGNRSMANQNNISKSCIYKHYNVNCFKESNQRFSRVSESVTKDGEICVEENNDQNGFTGCILNSSIEDIRECVFCYQRGDGVPNGPSRLLNFDIDKWVHLNCALWSSEVYETISGGLMNFPAALQMGLNQSCSGCQQLGATVRCFKNRCNQVFHLPCAIREHCVFYKNKTIHCQQHANRLEKENELSCLTVHRRVFVERDENRQVATVMHHSELTNLLRVGTLIFLNIGQLLPHQLEAFHTIDHIYPVGYKVIRFYWSMKRPNRRCRYVCSINESAGRPEFRIQVQEPGSEIELRDSSPNAVWKQILTPIALMRKNNKVVQLFPQFISGEDLFGLTEPSVVRIIESLPGIETLTNYRFKYGRNPLLELPLAINPSGSARTEPKQRQIVAWRKPHTQRTGSAANQRMANSTTSIAGEIACPYSKQFVHSKSSQYKKMKQEWRNNVYLARSKIQGLGLYAARDIEKHTMIIEYIGEVIRTEVSEIREKQYEAKNRGIYMFRLDEDRVVDATLSGGLARYINHACNPNCVTETVDVDRELRIIIFAKRRINRGEELSYDYKFDIEDDAHKISCMCGSPNCRKWMN